MVAFKKGHKVWDVRHGNGIVIMVYNDADTDYPINVEFDDDCEASYTSGGKYYHSHQNRSLFHGHDLEVTGEVEPVEIETQYAYMNVYKSHNCFHNTLEDAIKYKGSDLVTTVKVKIDPV